MASFKSAFAAARKSGKSSFSWNGKSYNTKLKSDSSSSTSTGSTAKSGPTTGAKASAPSTSSRPKARSTGSPSTSSRPKARPARSSGPTVKSGTRGKPAAAASPTASSIRQTGKRPPRKDLSDTVVGRALHKAEAGINNWRDRMKSKIKANSKPSRGSRGRGRG